MFDMVQSLTIADSLKFGKAVMNKLGKINKLHKNQVEQAGFAVLKAPDIPSILVETAFISNVEEERKLKTATFQQEVAESILAATGPVGATVGQIGKLKVCRVVGVAGGAEKCRHATEVLGFDVCLDHHADDFAEQLAKACPKGIDIYYENVGGKVFDAVLPLLNTSARIPVCGLVSSYNATELPPGPDRLPLLMATVLKKRIRLQGFIIAQDYGHRIHEFQREMGQWVKEDKIHYREEITDGLENAAQTFIGLLKGKNFGKVVIRVAC
eukprot:875847_1